VKKLMQITEKGTRRKSLELKKILFKTIRVRLAVKTAINIFKVS
jgi:hypothetical protein